jgi:hypothetical protein
MAYTPTPSILETTWDDGNPTELDYLKPNGFRFVVHNLPNVSFFCQSVNIPDIQLGEVSVATPLHDLFTPGEKVRFGDLNIRFLIQENMANYRELYNWMLALGNPENSEQYTSFIESQAYRFPNTPKNKLADKVSVSDATLIVLDSNNNPVIDIQFQDMFPVAISGLDFDVSSGDTEYFQGVASFRYRQYLIGSV